MSKAIFKPTYQNQPSLFPFNFDGLIGTNHPVRLIDTIIEKLDITTIISTYKGGGTSSYHPRMLLKVVIFGYLNNLFSSRKIANALKENVYFMWLSGQSFPDHHTINNFRGKRLKGNIEEIFKQVVLVLVDSGIITLKEVFTDGTKMESVANRYTFVWKKSVEKNKQKLEKNIQAVLKEIDDAIAEDNQAKEETPQAPSLTSSELKKKYKK
jgi:transposase